MQSEGGGEITSISCLAGPESPRGVFGLVPLSTSPFLRLAAARAQFENFHSEV